MRALLLLSWLVGCVAVFGLLMLAACQGDGAGPAVAVGKESLGVSDYAVSGPYTHQNLTVFLIHGKDKSGGKHFVTLAEALDAKEVVVHETGEVNNLQIENLSDNDVWVQAGDIVKGGKQDRTFANDCIIPPKSGKVDMAAFCVENGRWRARGDEGVANFAASNNNNNGSSMKTAIMTNGMKLDHSEGQQEVWSTVGMVQKKLSASIGSSAQSDLSNTSMQLTMEKAEVRESTKGYLDAIAGEMAKHPDAIGYAAAINGKISTVDIYANHELFVKLWPKLLDATCVEAVSDFEKDKTYAAVTPANLRATMQEAASAKETATKDVAGRASLRQLDSAGVVSFECYDKASPAAAGGGGRGGAAPVHQAMIGK